MKYTQKIPNSSGEEVSEDSMFFYSKSYLNDNFLE